jgi:alkane 1-monooxygenase
VTPFLLVFLGPAVLLAAASLGGISTLVPPLVFFGLVPALDLLLPVDTAPTRGHRALRALPVLFAPVQVGVVGVALWRAATLPGWERVTLTVDIGLATAMAINVAHELMHRPSRVERALALILMATATYTHFCVEHVQGHHKNVGTARDPATARAGETLWAYLPRTLIGSAQSAWHIEAARPLWRNRVVRGWVLQALVMGVIAVTFGAPGLSIFLAQSALAVFLLETVNYVEHYGLRRAEIAPGRPERVQPRHSWNSPHRLSNWMLLNLARHSDHHAFPARPFPELRHHPDVPQLPASYSAMMLVATVPPLWFRVMDRRVDTYGRRGA